MLKLYSRALLLACATVCLAVLGHNLLHYEAYLDSFASKAERFAVPALLGAGLCAALRLRRDARLILTNTLLAAIVALYCGEFYLARQLDVQQRAAAWALGLQADTRDKLQVIRDLRAGGADAYPIIRGRNFLESDAQGQLQPILSLAGQPLLPLAGLAGVEAVSCNETGQWQVYRADRNGFNNDDAAWDDPPAIAMVGDSFAHGSCVERGQTMEALLAQRFGTTLNLGVGGMGPMLELAVLTEYAKPVRPRIVLWAFFEGNDLNEDLPFETRAPMLHRYLNDPGFSQDLVGRRDAVAGAVRAYLDHSMDEAMRRVDDPNEDWMRYVSLDRVRSAVGLGPVQIGYNGGDLGNELALFGQVMRAARDRVRAWGGELRIVYLPESDRYLSRFGGSTVRTAIHDGVQAVAEREGIPVIDVAAAFAREPDPAALFAYPGSHYNPAGYAAAARAIEAELDRNAR